MTKNVKAAIQTLGNELDKNDILASNWSATFKQNIILAFADNNNLTEKCRTFKIEYDLIISLIEGVDAALSDLISNSNDPTSWVYNDKHKILDKEQALKNIIKKIHAKK